MHTPQSILNEFSSQQHRPLSELPDEHGIYGLIDHLGALRYIGVTASIKIGFHNRIYSRHVTGSEGRSHKFSHAYNTGRMWRSRASMANQRETDAKIAKRLRSAFCRTHCKAVFVPIPRHQSGRDYFSDLVAIEARVHAIATSEMRAWEGRDFPSLPEPTTLIDTLIDQMGLSSSDRDALSRQEYLFQLSGRPTGS